MEFEAQEPICENEGLKALGLLRKFLSKAPGAIVILHPAPSASRNAQAEPFDAGKYHRSASSDSLNRPRVCSSDEPRLFRYIFSSTINQATLTRLRVKVTRVWTRLILGADRF